MNRYQRQYRSEPKPKQEVGLLPWLGLTSLIALLALAAGIKNNGMVNCFAFFGVVVLPPIWAITGYFRYRADRGTGLDALGIMLGLIWLVPALFIPAFLVTFVISIILFGIGSWIVSSTAREVRHTYRSVRRNVDESDGVYNPNNYEE